MVPSLCRSALFLTLLAMFQPLSASVSQELPLPVKIEEIPATKRSSAVKTDALVEKDASNKAGCKGATMTVVPGLPLACSLQSLDFPDGMTLVVYRQGTGAADGDVHYILRGQDGTWAAPMTVGREGWRENIAKQPPFSVSQSAPRATVAWYTEADKEPRILVSQTPDAGQRWTSAMHADLGLPEGRLSQVTLSDGSILLCWLERPGDDASLPGGLYLRRYAPNGATAMPALLAIVAPEKLEGSPNLSVLEDTRDGSGVLRLDFTEASARHSLRITLPAHDTLEELDHSCRCGPAQDPGHALRARILSLDTRSGTVVLSHGALPGLLRPGELSVTLAPGLQAGLQAGDEILGRILETKAGWQLLAPRRLGGRP